MRIFENCFLFVIMITIMFVGNTVTVAFDLTYSVQTKTLEEFLTRKDSSPLSTPKFENGLHSRSEEINEQLPEYAFTDFWRLDASDKNIRFNGVERYSDFVVDDNSMEVIIGVNNAYQETYDDISDIIHGIGGKVVNTVSMRGSVIAIVAKVPLSAVSSFKKEVQMSGLARYMEPNVKFKLQYVPNDPNWTVQWGPQKIEADWAWNTTTGNHSVLVAVIDTGIDYTHPDLAANYIALGYDWVNEDTDPLDDHGHGTHCAGIIAAALNNGEGIAGLAQVRIMAEKVLSAGGYGTGDDIANAIIHAVDQGADILSNSYGGPDISLIHEAIQYAYNHGVLVIAAAGNEGSSYRLYPAAYEEVVAVTASDEFDNPAWFTSYGEWVEVAAPGVNIYSTLPTYNVTLNSPSYNKNKNYDYLSGTSMACPHAAGVAALIWTRFPNTSRDWITAQLQFTADDLGTQGFDEYYGYGRINARKAVEQVPQDHELLISRYQLPAAIQPGSVATFNITVTNFGINDEKNVTVQLFVDGNLTDSAAIDHLGNGTSNTIKLSANMIEERTYNVTFYVIPVLGESITGNNVVAIFVKAQHLLVAIFDNDVWTSPTRANQKILSSVDIPYAVFGSSDFGNINLSSFSKVVIAQEQDDVFYETMDTFRWWFEDYVTSGGILEIHAADAAWHNYTWVGPLPGGIIYNSSYHYHDIIIDSTHPTVTIPNRITDDELDKWECGANGYFISYPANSHVVIKEENTGYPVYLEVRYGEGTILASSQCLESYFGRAYPSHPFNLMLENSLLYTPNKYPDELIMSLQTPSMPQLSETSIINATVYNCGLNNETNVELKLLIDSTVVSNATIPELMNGTFFSINYQWTPSTEATYNVTAYTPPIPNENITRDNLKSKYVIAQRPLIKPIEEQYANYSLDFYSSLGHLTGTGNENYTYEHYIEPYKIRVIVTVMDPEGFSGSSYGIVNILNRYVETGVFANAWYPGWIETNITVGSKIKLLEGTAEVEGSKIITACSRAIDCWEIPYGDVDTFWYDKMSGLLVCREINVLGFRITRLLTDTNIPIGIRYDKDLGVTIKAPGDLHPGETSILNATVYNVGLTNETNVEIHITINDTQVASETLDELVTGAWHTVGYSWMPTAEGIYNITTYAKLLPNETATANNVASIMVFVRYAKVAVIFEGYELSCVASILDSMEIGFDMYYHNSWRHYTENLSLLLNYQIVIFIKSDSFPYTGTVSRSITYQEYLALESYLSGGGSLIVTGINCLLEDRQMSWIVRSSSIGDDWPQPDLNVVAGAHPIMDGPYGSFPTGYHISDLYDECDKAEADPKRNAVTVAELADGNDKIIATKKLPGKVVFWNGEGTYDWALNSDCEAMMKNTIYWFLASVHDVAVTKVTPSKTVAGQGFNISIEAEIKNQGETTETFNVTLYVDPGHSVIQEQTVTLESGASATLAFTWNTLSFAKGNYNLTVYAEHVSGEIDTVDNAYADIFVLITIPGDVDGDFKVDMGDIVAVCDCFGSAVGQIKYNANCDIDGNGRIDMGDIIIACDHFGEHQPQ